MKKYILVMLALPFMFLGFIAEFIFLSFMSGTDMGRDLVRWLAGAKK